MKQTYIKDLAQFVGQMTTLKGWLNHKRSSGSIAFLELRDGSGFIQCVVSKNDVSTEIWSEVEKASQESSIEVSGEVTNTPNKLMFMSCRLRILNWFNKQ